MSVGNCLGDRFLVSGRFEYCPKDWNHVDRFGYAASSFDCTTQLKTSVFMFWEFLNVRVEIEPQKLECCPQLSQLTFCFSSLYVNVKVEAWKVAKNKNGEQSQ